MDSEFVGIDPDKTDHLAESCSRAHRVVEEQIAVVQQVLFEGDLPTSARTYLVEASENLEYLGRYLAAKADEVRYLDRAGSQLWFSSLQAERVAALKVLRANLDDPDGAVVAPR